MGSLSAAKSGEPRGPGSPQHSPESLGKVYIGFSVVSLLVEHMRLRSVTFRLPLMTVLSDFQLLCMN